MNVNFDQDDIMFAREVFEKASRHYLNDGYDVEFYRFCDALMKSSMEFIKMRRLEEGVL